MRIAIFHNYMDNIGGAEMVALTLARELQGDLYSTVANQNNIRKMGFDVEVKMIGRVPVNAPLRQQLALARFRLLDLSSRYDYFIVCGDWAASAVCRNKPNAWYIHSPVREIWDLYEYSREYIVPGGAFPTFKTHAFDAWVRFNRHLNKKYAARAGTILCNSKNTQKRIKKYLDRDAVVVPPPVDTTRFFFEKTGSYWLSVNRLLPHKRVDMQLLAFEKLPSEKLIVVGSYEQAAHFLTYRKYIKRIAPGNVEIRSNADSVELRALYAGCRGFITTARDEDFGMTAVEAMAAGKPVIAPAEGGYRETVIDGATGKLIEDIDAERLAAAVREVGRNPERYKGACIKQARQFDTSIFMRKIRTELGI